MEEKIPKQIDTMYYNDPETRVCKYNFVFSNKIRDWIYSAQRVTKNGYKHKFNTTIDG